MYSNKMKMEDSTMKKILALLLAMMMVFTLAACGSNEETPSGSGTTDPGTSQQGQTGSGTTKKADGAQMDAATDHADSYTDVQTLSGLNTIGKPAGYKYKGSGEAGETRHIRFAPETDSFTVDSLDSYAAALWNLCIDTVKDGELIRYRLSGEHTVYENLSDTRKVYEDSGLVAYVWWYELNGEYLRLQLKQSADDGVIELTIEPYGSAE